MSLGLRARQGICWGEPLQDVPVQHHRAQQPTAEGPEEVTGCCRVVGLDDVHVTWERQEGLVRKEPPHRAGPGPHLAHPQGQGP